MEHRFREVRKGERPAVVAFAQQHGCTLNADQLRHDLSLVIEVDSAIAAGALCIEQETGQFMIEIVVGESSLDDALVTELADRSLRKVQAKDIAAARLSSTTEAPAQAIWSGANWLDRIEEAAPPQADEPEDEASQAA